MRSASNQIGEVAPGLSGNERSVLNEALAVDVGHVSVLVANGDSLGEIDLEGRRPAQVVVEMRNVSKGSGGELYRALSVHTPSADHYIIDTLPTLDNRGDV